MEVRVRDASGKSYGLKVDKENRAETSAVSVTKQHDVSIRKNNAYHVSHVASIASGALNLILIKNTDADKDLVFTQLLCHVTQEATETSSDYFTFLLGGNYSSGGTTLTSVNIYSGSPNSPTSVFYGHTAGSAIATSGTYSEIDRTYKVKNSNLYAENESIILPRNQSLLVRYNGSTAAGSAYFRASFYMTDRNGD